jgi:hypothetical protein
MLWLFLKELSGSTEQANGVAERIKMRWQHPAFS